MLCMVKLPAVVIHDQLYIVGRKCIQQFRVGDLILDDTAVIDENVLK